MNKTSKNNNVTTYTYSEVLQSIEGGINLWDFATKFGISYLQKNKFLQLLMVCTNNDKKLAEEYYSKLTANSTKWAKENIDRSEKLNYNTLLYLAKKGYSRVEIMKRFGRYSYTGFTYTLDVIYKKEHVTEEMKKNISKLLRKNTKPSKVSFIPDTLIPDEVKEVEITNNASISVCEEPQVSTNKIVFYTFEYLRKLENVLKDVYQKENERNIILSTTLSRFMNKTSSKDAQIELTDLINENKVEILNFSSEYKVGSHALISSENDFILSQALMLSFSTDKKIYIATCNPQTAINALELGLGVRFPKHLIIKNFSDATEVTEESEIQVDYVLPDVTPECVNKNSVTIIDTCVIINNANIPTKREKILADTTQLKILPRVVLNELTEPSMLFSTIYAAKCNPTIVLDLNTNLNYNYNDIAILNYALLYKKNTGKEIILLTHDFDFYVESLKYNVIKSKYHPSTYMKTFKVKKVENDMSELDISTSVVDSEVQKKPAVSQKEHSESFEHDVNTFNETDEFFQEDIYSELLEEKQELDTLESFEPFKHDVNTDDNSVYYQTVRIQKVSSKPVILHSSKIVYVKSAKTMEKIPHKGHKAYKYYPVELGDYVSFKNDPNLYKIVSLTGKDNLESVNLLN